METMRNRWDVGCVMVLREIWNLSEELGKMLSLAFITRSTGETMPVIVKYREEKVTVEHVVGMFAIFHNKQC